MSKMKLWQLMGDGTEELWNFQDDISEERIKELYKEWEDYYMDTTDEEPYDTFEGYMEEKYPDIQCERVFVDEIYV